MKAAGAVDASRWNVMASPSASPIWAGVIVSEKVAPLCEKAPTFGPTLWRWRYAVVSLESAVVRFSLKYVSATAPLSSRLTPSASTFRPSRRRSPPSR